MCFLQVLDKGNKEATKEDVKKIKDKIPFKGFKVQKETVNEG